MTKSSLKEVIIELTNACNQKCVYCTNDNTKIDFTPLSTIEKILLEAKQFNVPAIRFTGGEPLLYPQLKEALLLAKKLGFYTILNTNGISLNPDLLNTFQKTIQHVLISFQGFNQTSDQILTKTTSSFSQKIKNTLLLQKYIPYVRSGTVITPFVLQHLPQYIALFKKLQFTSWTLFRPINHEHFGVSKKDYQILILKLYQCQQTGLQATIGNALPFCIISNLKLASQVIFGAQAEDGHSRLVWSHQQFFKPSYFIPMPLGQTIHEALNHAFLKQLNKISYLPLQCQNCLYLTSCLGGCRAMAYLHQHSYWHIDPFYTPFSSQTSFCN